MQYLTIKSLAAAIILIAVLWAGVWLLFPDKGDEKGQPSPHALDHTPG